MRIDLKRLRYFSKYLSDFRLLKVHSQSSKSISTHSGHLRALASSDASYDIPVSNEPTLEYKPDSDERKAVDEAIERLEGKCTDIPIVIGDEEIKNEACVRYQVEPYDHKKNIAKLYYADRELIQRAIRKALEARGKWERTPQSERSKIFCKAADLVSEKYRADLVAATMIGQAKNVWQAEIDAAAELADFYRFNALFADQVTKFQPISFDDAKNSCIYRGCEGFWAAITPFNFTAIGGHLPMAPALMGNVVLWKPTESALLSNWLVFNLLREAGLPAGIINFVPSSGSLFGSVITESPHLAGINFTGSTGTFMSIWRGVASNLNKYKTYPRLIGECGGKNFHFVHSSADVTTVAISSIRAAFEYSGQKCSACSRLYVPESLWPDIRDKMVRIQSEIKVGPGPDRETFVSAVIDEKAFKRIKNWIEICKCAEDLEVIAGGTYDDSVGYYIHPTIVKTTNPKHEIMQEEIFGPVLTVYAYPDEDYLKTAKLMLDTSSFGLTGAIFSQDEKVTNELQDLMRDAVGNFYINDKATGSVVCQQPFGGARLSGTNDKAGGPHYLTRFVSMQAVKRSFVKQTEWRYPSMGA